ncbi:hypothetical protein OAT16_00330 [Prolixibacteraceae bacterium]|nr:hypothetical protein [Prolixibacteraceae bacterium]
MKKYQFLLITLLFYAITLKAYSQDRLNSTSLMLGKGKDKIAYGIDLTIYNVKIKAMILSRNNKEGREENRINYNPYYSGNNDITTIELGYAVGINSERSFYISPLIGISIDNEIWYDDGGYKTWFYAKDKGETKAIAGIQLDYKLRNPSLLFSASSSTASPFTIGVGFHF